MLAALVKHTKSIGVASQSAHTGVTYGQRRLGIASCVGSASSRPLVQRYLRRYMVPSFSNADLSSSSETLVITPAVADRIKELQKQDKNKKLYLRIVVDSGGCNGYLTTFELDDKDFAKDDIIIDKEGAHIVLDELSMGLMKGSTIDYVDEMARSTFVIVENPNAGTSCGCNTSFSLKEKPAK